LWQLLMMEELTLLLLLVLTIVIVVDWRWRKLLVASSEIGSDDDDIDNCYWWQWWRVMTNIVDKLKVLTVKAIDSDPGSQALAIGNIDVGNEKANDIVMMTSDLIGIIMTEGNCVEDEWWQLWWPGDERPVVTKVTVVLTIGIGRTQAMTIGNWPIDRCCWATVTVCYWPIVGIVDPIMLGLLLIGGNYCCWCWQ